MNLGLCMGLLKGRENLEMWLADDDDSTLLLAKREKRDLPKPLTSSLPPLTSFVYSAYPRVCTCETSRLQAHATHAPTCSVRLARATTGSGAFLRVTQRISR